MEKGRYSIIMLLGSILAGLVYAFLGEFFYSAAQNILPGIAITAVYFTGLFLFLGIAVYLIGKLVYSQSYSPVNKKQWILTFVLIIGLSCLFEFIYEIIQPGERLKDFDSYLFIIDDSGSMEITDPGFDRYKVIENMTKDKPEDFRYGIYSFSDETTVLRDMAPVSVKSDFAASLGGGTAIKGALTTVLADIDTGKLKDMGNCRILLLSDGEATDVDAFNKYRCTELLDDYAKKGISISTIGFEVPDDELMNLIADKTGGVYVKVENIDQLENGMMEAAKVNKIYRNLLGFRDNSFLNILLGILRIVFVAGLGVIIALEKTILCERFINTTSVLISSLFGGILAGICLEIGMNGLGIPPVIMRTLTCILIAFVLLRQDLYLSKSRGARVIQ